MRYLYTIAIWWYGVAIRIAALFSEKARQWVSGRKGLFGRLETQIGEKSRWIWVHAASLGEFEQGRPLIELIRREHPEVGILLTFYSPSGYLIRKDYPHADYVTYMPLDTPWNARRFVQIVRPVAVLFVKYEIWYHHLRLLQDRGIPTFLIAAHLRPDHVYFRFWAGFLLKRLKAFNRIFTQTEGSAQMLLERGFQNVMHTGDTRLDRVLEIASAPREFGWLVECLPQEAVLVAGSTWPEDEQRLIPALLRMKTPALIAPHEISAQRVDRLQKSLPGAVRISELRMHPRPVRYVIVDTIGELAFLYSLGTISYVGGGFGKGIHNVLEPVAYGLPVLVGPRFQKFAEAVLLEEAGVLIPVRESADVDTMIKGLKDIQVQENVRRAIAHYIQRNSGATRKIFSELAEAVF